MDGEIIMKYPDNYLVSNNLYCESIFETEEARTWAIHYKKLYEYAEGYRHGWQVQSEIEEELRKQAEQERDELQAQSVELVKELKEIGEYDKIVPDSVPLGVLLIIDRSLINYREK